MILSNLIDKAKRRRPHGDNPDPGNPHRAAFSAFLRLENIVRRIRYKSNCGFYIDPCLVEGGYIRICMTRVEPNVVDPTSSIEICAECLCNCAMIVDWTDQQIVHHYIRQLI